VPADFLFTIELTDEPDSDRMLAGLAGAVLAYAGLPDATVDRLSRALHHALADGAAPDGDGCRVRFEAAAGTLTVGVVRADGAQWQASEPLP
jgi:hypothetical protein